MEAHNLQQQLASQFGLSVLLEEGLNESFTIVLNGATIYTNLTEAEPYIDHEKIISSIGAYKEPLEKKWRKLLSQTTTTIPTIFDG